MKNETINLWEKVPGKCEETPKITAYIPEEKKSDAAIVIFPGGGYCFRAEHEGRGYAEFFCDNGITAFDVCYRVYPHQFPLELLDARRAIQTVRHYADKLGIDKNKILVMGSSAGGHLAALSSTYFKAIDEFSADDEISKESFIPNGQILCYPVINLAGKPGEVHFGSGKALLGENYAELSYVLSPTNCVNEKTPPAFIWHTFEDAGVNVKNSLEYANALKNADIDTELHIYPHGPHGMGIPADGTKVGNHIRQWTDSLIKWLEYMNFTDGKKTND